MQGSPAAVTATAVQLALITARQLPSEAARPSTSSARGCSRTSEPSYIVCSAERWLTHRGRSVVGPQQLAKAPVEESAPQPGGKHADQLAELDEVSSAVPIHLIAVPDWRRAYVPYRCIVCHTPPHRVLPAGLCTPLGAAQTPALRHLYASARTVATLHLTVVRRLTPCAPAASCACRRPCSRPVHEDAARPRQPRHLQVRR